MTGVLSNFLDADGRLHTIPTKHAKLLVVLDFLAQSLRAGAEYPEAQVNEILDGVPPRLRRAAPLPRRERLPRPGRQRVYWRSGGTVDV